MKLFFAILFFAVLTIGCKKNRVECPRTEYSYTYKTHARIDTVRNAENWLVALPANGNNLVFTYEMNYITCPRIADGGLTRILRFEVSRSVSSFDYDSGDLQNAMVYFRRICFCTENGAVVPDSGTIKGRG